MTIEHVKFQDQHRWSMLTTAKNRREERRQHAAIARKFRRMTVTQ